MMYCKNCGYQIQAGDKVWMNYRESAESGPQKKETLYHFQG